jgi:hypothetical protein
MNKHVIDISRHCNVCFDATSPKQFCKLLMPWGKYRGCPIKWVFDADQDYIQYLFKNKVVNRKHPDVIAIIKALS